MLCFPLVIMGGVDGAGHDDANQSAGQFCVKLMQVGEMGAKGIENGRVRVCRQTQQNVARGLRLLPAIAGDKAKGGEGGGAVLDLIVAAILLLGVSGGGMQYLERPSFHVAAWRREGRKGRGWPAASTAVSASLISSIGSGARPAAIGSCRSLPFHASLPARVVTTARHPGLDSTPRNRS